MLHSLRVAPCLRPQHVHRTRLAPCRNHKHEHDHETTHEQQLGPNVVSKVGDLGKLGFSPAVVTRNDSLNLDGTARLIHLSVTDHVDLLYGRKVQGVQDAPRWIDNYTMPGQFVALRLPGGRLCKRLYSIASTPYESRRDSSYIDASLIEVVAERAIGPDDAALAELGPGSQLEVSGVVGRGFSALLSSSNGILNALEVGRPILCIALGAQGMVPIRALLSWTPLLAHATKSKVSCLALSRSAASAPFVVEYDKWREAGINFQPLYLEEGADALEALDKGLFLREGGFGGLAGSPSDVLVLMSGLTGTQASALSKRLSAKGVNHERMLFADFF